MGATDRFDLGGAFGGLRVSNYKQLALDVVGAVVGFYLGGPVGAEEGFAVASIAGGELFPNKTLGPKISDNRTTTASIGEPVPIVFGTCTVAGTVCWLGPLQTTTASSKGSSASSYSYAQSIAIALCERADDDAPDSQGAIGGITRIWENGALVYDIRPQLALDSYLDQAAESDANYANRLAGSANYATKFTLYLGDELQTADPTIEAVEGYGNVPPFRGLAYIVFPNRGLTVNQGLRHPNFQFEVSQASGLGECTTAVEYSSEQLYPWMDNGLDGDPTNPHNINTYYIRSVDPAAPVQPVYVDQNVGPFPNIGEAMNQATIYYGFQMDKFQGYSVGSPTDDAQSNIGYISTAGAPTVGDAPLTKSVQLHFNSAVPFSLRGTQPGDPSFGTPSPYYGYFSGVGPWLSPGFTNNPSGDLSLLDTPGSLWWQGNALFNTSGFTRANQQSQPILTGTKWFHCSIPNGGTNWVYSTEDLIIGVFRSPAPPKDPCADLPASKVPGYCTSSNGILIEAGAWVLDTSQTYLALQIATSLQANAIRGYVGPTIPMSSADNNETYWRGQYAQAVSSGLLPAGYVYAANGDNGIHNVYPQICVNAYVRNTKTCTGSSAETSVSDIITAICKRAGLSAIDVSDMASVYVNGYAISSSTTGTDAISPLRSVAFFDAVESGSVLRFQSRGKPIAATLTTDDFGAYDDGQASNVPASVNTSRADPMTLPRSVRLHYKDITRDYEDNEQDSIFKPSTAGSLNDQDVSLPLCLGATQALQAADVLWQDSWTGATTHEVYVDQAWLQLEPGDVIALPIDGYTRRVRIASDSNASGVLRKLSLIEDDDANYVSHRVAAVNAIQAQQMKLLAATNLLALDLPSLDGATSDAGFYFAAFATGGNSWPGCTIYQSIDGGSIFTQQFSIVEQSTSGTLDAPIPVSQAFVWDDATVINVTLASDSMSLDSKTDDLVLAGGNAAAVGADGRWEVIQFANATKTGTAKWSLSRLLRGRRGTEYLTGQSMAGDTFVILTSANLQREVLSTAQVGAALQYKGVTIGATLASASVVTFSGHAQALKPFSPVDVIATRQPNQDIELSWTRRDRLGHTLMSGVDMPLSETTLAFQVDIYSATSPATVIRTLNASTVNCLYTAAQQNTDCGSTGLTDIKVAVYQMSATVGRGTPAIDLLSLTMPVDSPSGTTHEMVATFGGTFDSSNNTTLIAVFTPTHGGSTSSNHFLLLGSSKTSLADYATDLAAQVAAALGSNVTTAASGATATITSTSGTFTGSFENNSPTATVNVFQESGPTNAGLSSIYFVDLYASDESLAPSSGIVYETGGDASITFYVNAYDEVENTRLSRLSQPTIPTGLQQGDKAIGGLLVSVGYAVDSSATTSSSALDHLAAAITASSMSPYLLGASLGQLTGTAPGTMPRVAVSITMKPGYYLTGTVSSGTRYSHPSGYAAECRLLQNGAAIYSGTGRPKIAAVQFNDAFNSTPPGTYYSVLELGQVYTITLNGTSYSHVVDTTDMADPRTDLGTTAYYRDGIYNDLATQIGATNQFTVDLSKFYRSGSTTNTWIYQMVITAVAGNSDFTITAGVPFGLDPTLTIT